MDYQEETITEQNKAKTSRGLARGMVAHRHNFGTWEVVEERSGESEASLGYIVKSSLL